MSSLVNDEDSSDDDKKESVEPILEELNQVIILKIWLRSILKPFKSSI